MINQIIEYSGRNRAVIIVLVAMLVFAGLWSMRQIPLDAIPDLSDPQVIIYTEWPGRSPLAGSRAPTEATRRAINRGSPRDFVIQEMISGESWRRRVVQILRPPGRAFSAAASLLQKVFKRRGIV